MNVSEQTVRSRVVSGMRPTGKAHLGNYVGALRNWVRLQDEFDCFFFIADWHALTTDYADTSRVLDNVYELTLDLLSAGLEPEKCTLFVQSHVPQHAELSLLFGMITPLSWLERVPTYKDQQEQMREKDLGTYGFLGYPLLQSADILLYRPRFVPVGQDQAAHVELTREVARRFNQLYSPKRVAVAEGGVPIEEADPARLILPEPEVLMTPSPKLLGLDGRKMSKSYGNTIALSEHPASVQEKISRMSNGGQRNPQSEPGDPQLCPVGELHRLFSMPEVVATIEAGCRTATILCAECKSAAASGVNVHLGPIQERRRILERQPTVVWDVLAEGSLRAQNHAEKTLESVREVLGLSRTRRPVPTVRRALAGLEYPEPHSLSAVSHWWEAERAVRRRNLREHWLQHIVPTEIRLKQDSEQVYVTERGKRALVAIEREFEPGVWTFEVKPKTYEVFCLLCWSSDYTLYDFVIPQHALAGPWLTAKKRAGKQDVSLSVHRDGGSFSLHLPDSEPIAIDSFRGQYKPLV